MSLKSLFKSRKFYLTILLLLTLGAGGVSYFLISKKEHLPGLFAEPAQQAQAVKPNPEELALVIENMSAPPQLTPEQIAEDARIDAEQVAHAREWLESADLQQRIAGAEQLSAYPTAEAEKLLAETLINDSEPDVRSASARSLVYVKNPDAKTLEALEQALLNDNEEVAFDAVNTLIAYAAREPFGSERAVDIIERLQQVVKTGQLQEKVQTVVQSFLNDQAASKKE